LRRRRLSLALALVFDFNFASLVAGFASWMEAVLFRISAVLDAKTEIPSWMEAVLSRMTAVLDAKPKFHLGWRPSYLG